jgi:hypothetical protein
MSGWAGWRDVNVKELLARESASRPAGNKYHAKKTTVDGQRFDSAHEARVYQELRAEQLAGQITHLQRQRRFPLIVNDRAGFPVVVGRYTADFVCRRNGELQVIDAKSRATRTEAYSLRKRLFEALFGLVILER